MPFTILGTERKEVCEMVLRIMEGLGNEAKTELQSMNGDETPGWWRAVVTVEFYTHYDNELSPAMRRTRDGNGHL
jgi:hypothetical protein